MLTEKLFKIIFLIGYWCIIVPFITTFCQENVITAQEISDYIWQYLVLFFVFVLVYFIVSKIFDNCYKNYEVREKCRKIQIRNQLAALERGEIDLDELDQASDIRKMVMKKNSQRVAVKTGRTPAGSPALGGRRSMPGSPALGGRRAAGGCRTAPSSPALGARKMRKDSTMKSMDTLSRQMPDGSRRSAAKIKKGNSMKSMDRLCVPENEMLVGSVDCLDGGGRRVRKLKQPAEGAARPRDCSPNGTLQKRKRSKSALAARSMSTLPRAKVNREAALSRDNIAYATVNKRKKPMSPLAATSMCTLPLVPPSYDESVGNKEAP